MSSRSYDLESRRNENFGPQRSSQPFSGTFRRLPTFSDVDDNDRHAEFSSNDAGHVECDISFGSQGRELGVDVCVEPYEEDIKGSKRKLSSSTSLPGKTDAGWEEFEKENSTAISLEHESITSSKSSKTLKRSNSGNKRSKSDSSDKQKRHSGLFSYLSKTLRKQKSNKNKSKPKQHVPPDLCSHSDDSSSEDDGLDGAKGEQQTNTDFQPNPFVSALIHTISSDNLLNRDNSSTCDTLSDVSFHSNGENMNNSSQDVVNINEIENDAENEFDNTLVSHDVNIGTMSDPTSTRVTVDTKLQRSSSTSSTSSSSSSSPSSSSSHHPNNDSVDDSPENSRHIAHTDVTKTDTKLLNLRCGGNSSGKPTSAKTFKLEATVVVDMQGDVAQDTLAFFGPVYLSPVEGEDGAGVQFTIRPGDSTGLRSPTPSEEDIIVSSRRQKSDKMQDTPEQTSSSGTECDTAAAAAGNDQHTTSTTSCSTEPFLPLTSVCQVVFGQLEPTPSIQSKNNTTNNNDNDDDDDDDNDDNDNIDNASTSSTSRSSSSSNNSNKSKKSTNKNHDGAGKDDFKTSNDPNIDNNNNNNKNEDDDKDNSSSNNNSNSNNNCANDCKKVEGLVVGEITGNADTEGQAGQETDNPDSVDGGCQDGGGGKENIVDVDTTVLSSFSSLHTYNEGKRCNLHTNTPESNSKSTEKENINDLKRSSSSSSSSSSSPSSSSSSEVDNDRIEINEDCVIPVEESETLQAPPSQDVSVPSVTPTPLTRRSLEYLDPNKFLVQSPNAKTKILDLNTVLEIPISEIGYVQNAESLPVLKDEHVVSEEYGAILTEKEINIDKGVDINANLDVINIPEVYAVTDDGQSFIVSDSTIMNVDSCETVVIPTMELAPNKDNTCVEINASTENVLYESACTADESNVSVHGGKEEHGSKNALNISSYSSTSSSSSSSSDSDSHSDTKHPKEKSLDTNKTNIDEPMESNGHAVLLPSFDSKLVDTINIDPDAVDTIHIDSKDIDVPNADTINLDVMVVHNEEGDVINTSIKEVDVINVNTKQGDFLNVDTKDHDVTNTDIKCEDSEMNGDVLIAENVGTDKTIDVETKDIDTLARTMFVESEIIPGDKLQVMTTPNKSAATDEKKNGLEAMAEDRVDEIHSEIIVQTPEQSNDIICGHSEKLERIEESVVEEEEAKESFTTEDVKQEFAQAESLTGSDIQLELMEVVKEEATKLEQEETANNKNVSDENKLNSSTSSSSTSTSNSSSNTDSNPVMEDGRKADPESKDQVIDICVCKADGGAEAPCENDNWDAVHEALKGSSETTIALSEHCKSTPEEARTVAIDTKNVEEISSRQKSFCSEATQTPNTDMNVEESVKPMSPPVKSNKNSTLTPSPEHIEKEVKEEYMDINYSELNVNVDLKALHQDESCSESKDKKNKTKDTNVRDSNGKFEKKKKSKSGTSSSASSSNESGQSKMSSKLNKILKPFKRSKSKEYDLVHNYNLASEEIPCSPEGKDAEGFHNNPRTSTPRSEASFSESNSPYNSSQMETSFGESSVADSSVLSTPSDSSKSKLSASGKSDDSRVSSHHTSSSNDTTPKASRKSSVSEDTSLNLTHDTSQSLVDSSQKADKEAHSDSTIHASSNEKKDKRKKKSDDHKKKFKPKREKKEGVPGSSHASASLQSDFDTSIASDAQSQNKKLIDKERREKKQHRREKESGERSRHEKEERDRKREKREKSRQKGDGSEIERQDESKESSKGSRKPSKTDESIDSKSKHEKRERQGKDSSRKEDGSEKRNRKDKKRSEKEKRSEKPNDHRHRSKTKHKDLSQVSKNEDNQVDNSKNLGESLNVSTSDRTKHHSRSSSPSNSSQSSVKDSITGSEIKRRHSDEERERRYSVPEKCIQPCEEESREEIIQSPVIVEEIIQQTSAQISRAAPIEPVIIENETVSHEYTTPIPPPRTPKTKKSSKMRKLFPSLSSSKDKSRPKNVEKMKLEERKSNTSEFDGNYHREDDGVFSEDTPSDKASTPAKPKRSPSKREDVPFIDDISLTEENIHGAPTEPRHFVVVAIDFGTTHSGYAFSFTRHPSSIYMMRVWAGEEPGVTNHKTLTSLLLDPEGNFHSFGYSARSNYLNLVPLEARHWLYFSTFKMELHNNTELNRDTLLVAANGVRFPAMRVFAHSLQFFKEHALQQLSDQSGTEILNEDIRWVITVPAIWKAPAKQFMRQAAYDAELAGSNYPGQLIIALEPEAASIYCRRLRMYQLVPDQPIKKPLQPPSRASLDVSNQDPVVTELFVDKSAPAKDDAVKTKPDDMLESQLQGSRYLVVDCGGGTVDITVHELDAEGYIKELHRATGGPYGSIGVDLEFERLLCGIFGVEFVEHYKRRYPMGWVHLMTDFESRKRSASPYKNSSLNISPPFTFLNDFKKHKCDPEVAVKKYGDPGIEWSPQGMLRLNPVAMRRLFLPTVTRIKQEVGDVINHPNARGLKYFFLVGGFAESPLLQHEMRQEFENIMRPLIPIETSLAVLKGAVMFGIDPSLVRVRRSRLTYGVGILNRFDEARHPESKRVRRDGVDWCTDIFDQYVETDQPVMLWNSVIRSYTPAKPGQVNIVLNIYSSHNPNVRFITDPGVSRCGTLCLTLPDIRADDNITNTTQASASSSSSTGRRKPREIRTRMSFGDTEINVTAVDVVSGRLVKASVDFLGK